jgi:o-succinylbenzoate---CoA ligase
VTSRRLHAVLLPPHELLAALSAALEGTGPAIIPLDPALPPARLAELITALQPTAIVRQDGLERLDADQGVDEDVAVVLATSGSTGTPKGAELTADALLASARASLARLAVSGVSAGRGRWLCCLPTHHISGIGVLVRSLITGVDPVVTHRIDASLIEAAGCDYVSLVPTQLRRLLEAGAPVNRFDAILVGGAAAPGELLDAAAAAGARVITTYGMTETCGGCVYSGLPLDGVEVAAGESGLIQIAGPVLFSRYRLDPELTRASRQDGWFVTADLGEVAPDGHVVLHGRADDVINSGGEKVVPGPVEQALRSFAPIRDAVVVGTPDREWGERVVAIIATSGTSAPPDLAQLRRELQGKIPRYALPRGLICLEEIPMLASGKPDRLRLRLMAAERCGQDAAGSGSEWLTR